MKYTVLVYFYGSTYFWSEFLSCKRNLTLLSESVQVNGIKVCGDQGSLTWGHMSATPMRVNKLWAQEGVKFGN